MIDNKLQKAFDLLRAEGWYCAWGLPCCQSCAWAEIPFEHEEGPFIGKEVDIEKVLFNHEQDIEDESVWNHIDVDEVDEDEIVPRYFNMDEQRESVFCFDGSRKGVKNLKKVLPIFEQCGIKVYWNGKGNSRIELNWT